MEKLYYTEQDDTHITVACLLEECFEDAKAKIYPLTRPALEIRLNDATSLMPSATPRKLIKSEVEKIFEQNVYSDYEWNLSKDFILEICSIEVAKHDNVRDGIEAELNALYFLELKEKNNGLGQYKYSNFEMIIISKGGKIDLQEYKETEWLVISCKEDLTDLINEFNSIYIEDDSALDVNNQRLAIVFQNRAIMKMVKKYAKPKISDYLHSTHEDLVFVYLSSSSIEIHSNNTAH